MTSWHVAATLAATASRLAKPQGAAAKLLEEYGGDLTRLHAVARDTGELPARLKEFRGVGDTTAGIFLRELRGL